MANDSDAAESLTSPDKSILPNEFDHAALQQPLNLGVRNVKQILKCIQSGSPEVRDLILNECNIIYECKVCLSLFRSLANFLYHKRAYCKHHRCEEMLLFENVKTSEAPAVYPVSKETKLPRNVEIDVTSAKTSVIPTKTDNGSIMEMDSITNDSIFVEKPAEVEACDIRKNSSTNLKYEIPQKNFDSNTLHETRVLRSSCLEKSKILNSCKAQNVKDSFGLQDQSLVAHTIELLNTNNNEPLPNIQNEKIAEVLHITLKTIDGNSNAVLQTVQKASGNDCISSGACSDVSDPNTSEKGKKHAKPVSPTSKSNIISKNEDSDKFIRSSVSVSKDMQLSRRKRLLNRNDCNVAKLMCCNCQTQFTTLRTLYFHMISFHSHTRMYFPCPFCKTLFVQMYGVTRHLMQVHGKRKEQINNKLRETIRKKAIWKRINEDDSKKEKLQVQETSSFSKNHEKNESDKQNSDGNMCPSNVKEEKKNLLHYCSKCNRVFNRKSSQVSHEKFCIMNSQQEQNEASKLISTKASPPQQSLPSELKLQDEFSIKISTRPKRAAEKQMHKDFVNSQTLKWRSANKIETNIQSHSKKSKKSKIHERKIFSIVNVAKLTCLKCNKRFSSFSNLRRHAAIHIGWTRYKCIFCNDYQSYNRSECRHHVERAHSVTEENLDKYVVSLLSDVSSDNTSQKHNHCCKTVRGKGYKIADKTVHVKKHKQSAKSSTQVPKCGFSVQKHKGHLEHHRFSNNKSSYKKNVPAEETKKLVKKLSPEAKKCLENKIATVAESKKSLSNSKKDKGIKNDAETKQVCLKGSYKSVTTSNPTTIILSKTCSSSSVQIVKNHTSVKCDSFDKLKYEDSAVSHCNFLCTSSSQSVSQISPCKYTKISGSDNVQSGSIFCDSEKSIKKNRSISDWLTKQAAPTTAPRRDAAPLIIGLVPAKSSNICVSKSASSS